MARIRRSHRRGRGSIPRTGVRFASLRGRYFEELYFILGAVLHNQKRSENLAYHDLEPNTGSTEI